MDVAVVYLGTTESPA